MLKPFLYVDNYIIIVKNNEVINRLEDF